MDIRNDHTALGDEIREAERLHSELEQARVGLEDMDARIAELSACNATLQEQLRQEVHIREALQRELEQLRTMPQVNRPDTTAEDALREQLSIALEEMQVMAEELSLAQNALQEAAGSH